MNLTKLYYFKTVCESESLSAAATLLHVSQPSLSASIKDLEKEFGLSLFRRRYKGLTVTEEGKTLYRLSLALLDHAEQIKRTMTDIGNGKRTLRLGIPPMIGSLMLSSVCTDYRSIEPEVELQITEAGTAELLVLLQTDRLDIIIIPHEGVVDKTLRATEIAEFELVCCVHKEHALARKREILPADLANERLVLFKNSFHQTERIRRWFAGGAVEPRILFQTDQLSTLVSMIESGQTVGFMFRELIKEETPLCALSMKDFEIIKVSLLQKADRVPFRAMKSFLEYAKGRQR
ncbi:MAG: LysR family transcriptional regulator [Clostridia bacterium]|nr:LysR family transcriptional regulator [Clostridia bacterium]